MSNKSFYIPLEKMPFLERLGGGIPRGTITAALGAPGAAKSTLFMQACVEVSKYDKGNILIFDTENKFHVFLELSAGLSERYGINLNLVRVRGNVKKTGQAKEPKYDIEWEFEDEVDPKATNVFVVHCPEIRTLSIMWGRGFEWQIYESGKFKCVMLAGAWCQDIEDSPVAKFFTKNKCKVVLVDSVTNPLDEIPAVSENFPARTDGTQALMIQFHKVAAYYDVPIFATFHESKNDTSPFSKQLKIEGGKGVGYNLAFTIYMLLQNELGLLPKGTPKPKTLARDERAMFLARWPGRKPWAAVEYMTITDQGLIGGDEEVSSEESEEETIEAS